MARVVQRSSPPYLAIVFVFLFFIAAGLAGWFYANWRTAETEAADAADTLRSLATRAELSDQVMAALKARAADQGRSVVGQYRQDILALIGKIAGSSAAETMTVAEVVEKADLEKTDDGDGLLSKIARLSSRLAAETQRAADLEAQLAQANAQMTKALVDAAEAQGTLADQLRQNREQLTALQSKFDTLSGDFQSQVEQAKTDWDARVKALEAELATANRQIDPLEAKVRSLEADLERLKRGQGGDTTAPGPKPELLADGKILKVLEAEDHTVVYIDIGRNDRVRTGLTFAVHDKYTGVSPEGEGKATIMVKSVSPRTAQCLVLRSRGADPVAVGDLIANLAFSSARQPVFVVEGEFDLDADGAPDTQGAEAVKAMIGRFGGYVADEITVNTDYVVMGMEPATAARPDPDAPPTDAALWESAQQKSKQYEEMVSSALALNKPILNTSQLLAYIGFVPEVLEP